MGKAGPQGTPSSCGPQRSEGAGIAAELAPEGSAQTWGGCRDPLEARWQAAGQAPLAASLCVAPGL